VDVLRAEPPFDWRPGAPHEFLRRRASMLSQIRAFFAERGVLEVDTPQVINHAVSDPHLHSAQVLWTAGAERPQYLHTSPEYAMKRLLAAGSADIYQTCHVFRGEERGRHHNSEFMLLEWYRRGYSLTALMHEVEELLRALLGAKAGAPARHLNYEQLFIESLGCNPLSDPDEVLAEYARKQGFEERLVRGFDREQLLDLLMAMRIGPTLGLQGPVFVHRYPASQAALARLDGADARVALRFELYLQGLELANGFEELGDADEQLARFRADQETRADRGLAVSPIDEYLIAALRAGLPDCAGVALGFDRLLMIDCGAQRIGEVMPFTNERA
jgi:lysyl-tRNA synthetase class 2